MYLITFNFETVNSELELAKAAAQEYFNKNPRLSFAPTTLEEFKVANTYKELCAKVEIAMGKGGITSTSVQGEYVQSIWTQSGEIIHIVYYGEKFHSLKESQVLKVVRQLDQGQVPYTVPPTPVRIGEVLKTPVGDADGSGTVIKG